MIGPLMQQPALRAELTAAAMYSSLKPLLK
jgi:hypothetical protein